MESLDHSSSPPTALGRQDDEEAISMNGELSNPNPPGKIPVYATERHYTSMSSPGFEPNPYGIALSVANHYTCWATK
ncbi:hypothetical protein TNCV_1066291 [Trichonephila clavipes]|nr:hypothetical protein TNCV_1066291 [Trichonephila clavipes]